MKRKNVLLYLLSVLILSVLLVGCASTDVGNGDKNSEKVESNTQEEESKETEKATTTVTTNASDSDIDLKVQEDLLNYINNDLIDLSMRQDEIAEVYTSVSGENYTDDWTMYDVIYDEIVPEYLSFLDDLENVRIKSREVRELNEMLISANTAQYNAMVKMLAAIDAQDTNLVVEANQLLDQGRKGMRDFTYKLEDLCNEYEIDLEEILSNY